jgi:hypothetical protein
VTTILLYSHLLPGKTSTYVLQTKWTHLTNWLSHLMTRQPQLMGWHLCFKMDTLGPSEVNPIDMILWHKHLLCGINCETNNETTAAARQRPMHNNANTVESGVFYVVHSKTIWLHRPSSVHLVSAVQLSTVKRVRWWAVSQSEDCCSYKLVAEAQGQFTNPEEGERPPL